MTETPSLNLHGDFLSGFTALYFSDVYLPSAIQDPSTLAQIQAIKGGVEVALTAGLILVLTHRSRRALNKQNDRMDAMIAERSILYRVFRHNLRNDINVVMGVSDIIRETATDPELADRAKTIRDRAAAIGRYQDYTSQIEDMLDPSRSLVVYRLEDLLSDHPIIDEFRDHQAVSISIDVPSNLDVVAIPQLPSVIDELVENTITHNTASDPCVEITATETNRMIEVCISDNGSGIPEYEQQPITGMQEQQLLHSSGLGLWQAKLACTISGGDLVFPDQSNGGQVILRLPSLTHRNLWRKAHHILR